MVDQSGKQRVSRMHIKPTTTIAAIRSLWVAACLYQAFQGTGPWIAPVPRHVPKYIFPVPGVPYIMNGKKVEILVKKLVSGKVVKVSPTIVNPEILDSYKEFIQAEEASERQQLLWDSRGAYL